MPYFYKLREKNTGKYYVGCQYAKHAESQNLGVVYFTSSKYIKSKQWEDFEICYIVDRGDARSHEARYLKKCFGILGRERFEELMINRNIAPGILNTPESLVKANGPKKKQKMVDVAKKRLAEGTHNFITNRYTHSKEWYVKIKQRMGGAQNPGKNPLTAINRNTDEFRRKQAEGSRGNTNVRGKLWWNKGSDRKRSKESPGEGWTRGYKFISVDEKSQTNG